MPHVWSRLAGFSTQTFLQRCSRHAWLEACCPMGCRDLQASQPRLCAKVLEACIVEGVLIHVWSRLAGLSTQISVQTFSGHAWLEA